MLVRGVEVDRHECRGLMVAGDMRAVGKPQIHVGGPGHVHRMSAGRERCARSQSDRERQGFLLRTGRSGGIVRARAADLPGPTVPGIDHDHRHGILPEPCCTARNPSVPWPGSHGSNIYYRQLIRLCEAEQEPGVRARPIRPSAGVRSRSRFRASRRTSSLRCSGATSTFHVFPQHARARLACESVAVLVDGAELGATAGAHPRVAALIEDDH